MKDQRCKTCKFFSNGFCRRHAPVTVLWTHKTSDVYYSEVRQETRFPQVFADGMCGDWENKDGT